MLFRTFLPFLTVLICFGADDFFLAGRVQDGTSGEPLKNALVSLECSRPLPTRALLSDITGAFRFEGLKGDGCQLRCRKPAYAEAEQEIKLGPSQDNLVIKLDRLGTIRGRVSTTDREPVQGVGVQLWQSSVRYGRRTFSRIAYADTDDRGDYVLADVHPGVYVLHAAGISGGVISFVGTRRPRIDEEESFAPIFYGGGNSLTSAATVQVDKGKEVRADFSVPMQRAYAVTGSVSGMAPYRPVTLLLLTPDLTAVRTRAAVNAATGEFRVADVVPGSYILRARQEDAGKFTIAEVPVQVSNGPVRDLRLVLAPGMNIPINLRGVSNSGFRPSLFLYLMPATPISGGAYQAFISPARSVAFEAVVPGRYRVTVLSGTACVQSMTAGNQDLLLNPEISVVSGEAPAPVDVVVSESCGTVEAKIPPETSKGAEKTLVLLSASGGEPVTAPPNRDRYALRNVRPGDYTALLCASDFAYAEPEVREKSGLRGQPVKVQAGVTTTIQLEAPR